ncbi:Transmembrane protein [Hirschfeldia incana]|nr:Transmembrane protein [Hirschfeldia incana]
MWCASYLQPLPAGSSVLNHHTKQTESLGRKQVFLFISSSPSTSSLRGHQWQNSSYPKIGLKIKPKASVVPPSESGDITTFLLVSVAMISMYLVANFVVPSLLFKSLQGEEEDDSD